MTAGDVRSVVFQKAAVGGYKQADVDLFLEEVAVCIENMTAKIRSLEKAKFEARRQNSGEISAEPIVAKAEEKEEAPAQKSQGYEGISDYGIQSLLLRAQKLAEQIEAEARQASEELLSKTAEDAQDIITRADNQAAETMDKATAILADAQRKEAAIGAAARAEAENIINEAVARSEQMLTTTREKLKEERALCEKLRGDFDQVRAMVISFYEEQLNELNSEFFQNLNTSEIPEEFEEIKAPEVPIIEEFSLNEEEEGSEELGEETEEVEEAEEFNETSESQEISLDFTFDEE